MGSSSWVVVESGFSARPNYLVCEDVPGRLRPVCAVEEGHPNAEALAYQIAATPAMRAALVRAEAWFRDYARQHRAKGTAEGNLKADTNEERADFLLGALSAALNPEPRS